MAKGRGQGLRLKEYEIRRIVQLLSSTDMPLAQIAERMGCSKSAVIAVNRKHGVRDYAGQRSSWGNSIGAKVESLNKPLRGYSKHSWKKGK